jgi:carnitine O-acetyltransferase
LIVNTFSRQKELPLMPVPDLNITCRKLIEWSEPLLTEQESKKTKEEVEKFLQPGGEGERLQNELIEWAQRPSILNWFAPVWRDFYLACPLSLVINSNVFYYLKSKLDEKSNSQAKIASALISCVYDFIALIDNKELTVDMQKNQPLCMNQFHHLFSSTRIPRHGTDEFKTSSSRKHIVVMYNQRIYKLIIIDRNGNKRSPYVIEIELNCILSSSEKGQNLGVLSTMIRDQWAQSRADLLDVSPNNKQAMSALDNATFVLCLDEKKPEEITEISKQLLHGPGQDRFFDKSLQFIVFKNGKTGINFEHTGVDGSVMLRLVGHIYDTIDKVFFDEKKAFLQAKEAVLSNLKEIEFDLDDALRQTILIATRSFKRHVKNTQTRVLNFKQFGKNEIKKFGVSPDAFIQLALQLAEHKLYGKCYSAYEAVMTRNFLDGRLDALHTVSQESMCFIENISDAACNTESKIDSLIKAAKKHIERAKECRLSEGIYAHFLALQYRYKIVGQKIGIDKLPELFTDKGYQALTHSVVCTSTTSDYGVELAGYGPIVEDGYGIRYFNRNDCICFNMTSRTAMQDKLELMQFYIEQSLLEMAGLMRQRK